MSGYEKSNSTRFIDLSGMKFGMLTIISRAQNRGNKITWLCKCDCGNQKEIMGTNIKSGVTQSCGCLNQKTRGKSRRTHGMSKSRIYSIFCQMKARCYNENRENYKYYGEKGIDICSEWEDFDNFKTWAMSNGYKENLSIERKDFTKGYSPENCEWIPRWDQPKNRSNCVFLTAFGETKTAKEWTRDPRCTVTLSNLLRRIRIGINPEDSISKPSTPGKKMYQ